MNFQETGNKIPISAQELVEYVHNQLAAYDAFIAANKTHPDFNPYTHPIIYQTKDGKTIKIPDEIQKSAINDWYQQHGTNIPVMQQVPQQQAPVIPKLPQGKPQIIVEDDNGGEFMKLGLLIFVAVVALYLFYKYNHKSSGSSLNTEQIRAFMSK
ncbi:hypothetical protein QKU48_gp0827 [Fadolivirus algeromassiliense]|jgi:hypothetical protein|uniref:Uncharacterized protein n=1 Tax=Fadolivirus FV1/VV64 TaxID=3070911 RepID=A0A7D3QUN2_9VIRU|nr:hypothetical protein QKU48_gp0827 [Fadolivirus algeromassiliense]QKF94285.1 hypothetical protein Fadolivirus_1_827 [Fadolivirus FV1/VV64]